MPMRTKNNPQDLRRTKAIPTQRTNERSRKSKAKQYPNFFLEGGPVKRIFAAFMKSSLSSCLSESWYLLRLVSSALPLLWLQFVLVFVFGALVQNGLLGCNIVCLKRFGHLTASSRSSLESSKPVQNLSVLACKPGWFPIIVDPSVLCDHDHPMLNLISRCQIYTF